MIKYVATEFLRIRTILILPQSKELHRGVVRLQVTIVREPLVAVKCGGVDFTFHEAFGVCRVGGWDIRIVILRSDSGVVISDHWNWVNSFWVLNHMGMFAIVAGSRGELFHQTLIGEARIAIHNG